MKQTKISEKDAVIGIPFLEKSRRTNKELMEGDSEVRKKGRAVVVAQLTAWSLLIPEDPCSNPVIVNFY